MKKLKNQKMKIIGLFLKNGFNKIRIFSKRIFKLIKYICQNIILIGILLLKI
jgi:hypothetical protein